MDAFPKPSDVKRFYTLAYHIKEDYEEGRKGNQISGENHGLVTVPNTLNEFLQFHTLIACIVHLGQINQGMSQQLANIICQQLDGR